MTEIAVAVESSLYGPSTFSQGDLEEEWAGITAAFRLYERAGMTPALGWVAYEKTLGDESSGAA